MSYYHHFYSRIKDLYLELPNFSYFHSPSGRYRDNPKIVGRERVRKKLYGILTNSETKSGAYIITGFRGMGKTSLFNQVVNELQPRFVSFKIAAAIVFAWLTLFMILNILGRYDLVSIAAIIVCLPLIYWYNRIPAILVSLVRLFTNRSLPIDHKLRAKYKVQRRNKWFIRKAGKWVILLFNIKANYYKKSTVDLLFHNIVYG